MDTNWPHRVHALRAKVEERYDLSSATAPREQIVQEVRAIARELSDEPELVEAALDEIFGLGPLEPLLRDPSVDEIRIQGHATLVGVRDHQPERSDRAFRDDEHLFAILDRICKATGDGLQRGHHIERSLADGSTIAIDATDEGLDVIIRRNRG